MYDKPFIFKLNEGNGPDLLLQVFHERGWKEHSGFYGNHDEAKDSWNIWWKTAAFPISQWKSIKGWQFTNHVPKASCICRKDYLSRYLKLMKGTFGGIYDFSPDAFNLPLDYNKLAEKCSKSPADPETDVWICKPVGQSQGRGISLFRKVSDLVYGTQSVVQRYVKNPLLIGGYKFDLRLYVCVPCFHPLTVYAYREGLARFSTDKFSLNDLSNRYAHLTNSSLNKQGPGYLEMKDRVGAGCKWSLKKLRYYMAQNKHDDWLMWQRIATVIVLTIASQLGGIPSTSNCFEFYGFDVLIDSTLKPWLLEVNSSPALGTDCDVDPAVKKPMLHDMFDLLGLPICNTGLSLFCDWYPDNGGHLSKEEEPETFERVRKSNMAVNAVTVVTMANKWKRQLKTSGQNTVSKNRRITTGKRVLSGSRSAPTSLRTIKDSTPGRCLSNPYNSAKKSPKPTEQPKCRWENGRDWRDPPHKEGDWVRIYPFHKGDDSVWPEPDEDQNSLFGDKEIKNIVSNVIKYYRVAREIFAKTTRFSDEERDHKLLTLPGVSNAVWHP